jgi:hypothetical protein
MKTIITLIITSIIFLTCHAQKSDLALKLEQGKEYKQKTDTRTTISQEVNGLKIEILMTIKGTMTFLVKSISETNYDMDTYFDNLSMSIQLPHATMEFSSEKNDTNDIVSSILGTMKNKTFGIVMSRTGNVVEVKNIEALWESAINQFDQLPEAQKEQVKAQIMKAYGAEALKGNIEMVTAIYPEDPVNIGDK